MCMLQLNSSESMCWLKKCGPVNKNGGLATRRVDHCGCVTYCRNYFFICFLRAQGLFSLRQPILCDIVPSKSSDSKDSVDSAEVPVTVAMVIEETCMLCLEPISGACRELRCCCLVHVDCLLDWWKQSVETRPRREVESGILQLECRKCRKTVLNVVTKREIQIAHL